MNSRLLREKITPYVESLEILAEQLKTCYVDDLQRELNSQVGKPLFWLTPLSTYEWSDLKYIFTTLRIHNAHVGVVFPLLKLAFIERGYHVSELLSHGDEDVIKLLKSRGYDVRRETHYDTSYLVRKLEEAEKSTVKL